MTTNKLCPGLTITHQAMILPQIFFREDHPYCKICEETGSEIIREEQTKRNGEAIKRGLHELAAHGYHPSNTIAVGYQGIEVPLKFHPSGEPRWGNKPRYGIHLIKDETIAEYILMAWEMRLSGCSNREIHEATHLYQVQTPKKSPYSSYQVFFKNTLYAGILTFGGLRYPLNWKEGNTFCETYITLAQYEKAQS